MNKLDIAGRSKIWFAISTVVIVAGLICMFTKGFNFGIDFTGGTIVDLKFERPVAIAEAWLNLVWKVRRFSFPELKPA